MKICRYTTTQNNTPQIGLIQPQPNQNQPQTITNLTPLHITHLTQIINHPNPTQHLTQLTQQNPNLPQHPLHQTTLLPPVDQQEIWAAGVTYHRSKTARTQETKHQPHYYNHAYTAPRPELFHKTPPQKAIGTNDHIGIRKDSKWTVPEPELALITNHQAQTIGATIANDITARDIESQNPLYLPQAKTYDRSCALGPTILLNTPEKQIRQWQITLTIQRHQQTIYQATTSLNQIKRPLNQLTNALHHSQTFPHGAILLTGTGIIPPDHITLQPNDHITITIPPIGTLTNTAQHI